MKTHGIKPDDFPVCFKRWHKCIYVLLEQRIISDDFRYNQPVVISCDSQSINLTFYPNRAASPLIVNYQGRRFVQPRDTGVDIIPPAPLFFDHDSPDCWKDPEEFWEGVDEGYGAVPLPYAWQPYYSDLDSQLTSIQLTESTQPEQSEEGTVTVNASLSRVSSLAFEYNSDDSQNWFFQRQYRDTRPPSYFEVRRACSVIDFELDRLEPIDDTEYVVSCSDSDDDSELEEAFDWVAYTNSAHRTNSQQGHALCFSANVQDPTMEEIGDPSNLNNYLPDSGATQHMTPRRANLYDAVEGQNLGVEVADGHIIRCSTTGKVKISMLDDRGDPLVAELHGCMYVPGLSRRLFSITRFASNGHRATITKVTVTLYFGQHACPVMIPLKNSINIASNVRIVRRPLNHRSNLPHAPRLIPDRPVIRRGENHIKYTSLSLLHDRL